MPAMALSHVFHDGQPQAGTTGFARTAAVNAVKTLCQARQVFSFNTRPAVFDKKFSTAVLESPSCTDQTTLGRVTNCIAQQVRQGTQQL